MSHSNPAHADAANLAESTLPDYLGRWIAGVLRETHVLPALVHHQDRIAADVYALAAALGVCEDPED